MLAQKFAVSYLTKIILQLIQMMTSLIVARLLGPEVIGTLAYGLAFAGMFVVITDLGLGNAHARLIAENKENVTDSNKVFLVLKFFLVVTYILFTLSAYIWQKHISKEGFETQEQELVIIIYIVITVVSQIFVVFSTFWMAKMEQAKQDIPMLLQTITYQGIRIALAFLGYKAVAIALGNLAAVFLVIPLYFFLGRNIKFGEFQIQLAKRYFALSIPLLLILVSQSLIYTLDKLYLQAQTDLEMLGNYSAGITLSSFVKTIESSIGLLIFPLFTGYISAGQFEKVNQTIKKYERINFAFIMPLVLLASIFSTEIIHLAYGDKFQAAENVFAISLLTFFISTVSLPYANILTGLGKFKESAFLWVAVTILFFVSAVLFVDKDLLNLKGTGMALSLGLANTLLLVGYSIMISRFAAGRFNLFSTKRLVICYIIYYVGVYALYNFLNINSIPFSLIFAMFVFGAGNLIMIRLKLISKEDFFIIRNLLNVQKILNYLKSEIKK